MNVTNQPAALSDEEVEVTRSMHATCVARGIHEQETCDACLLLLTLADADRRVAERAASVLDYLHKQNGCTHYCATKLHVGGDPS